MDTRSDGAPGAQLGLVESAELMGGHRYVERELFTLTGRWSVEAATAAAQGAPEAAAIADFLATQSAVHSWRLAEWERRSPRSVEVSVGAGHTGWPTALEVADDASTLEAKLACWCHVLGVSLAARYRRHRSSCGPAADRGVIRWLEIAEHDVLDGVSQGTVVLQRCSEVTVAGTRGVTIADCTDEVAEVLRAFISGAS